MFPVIEARNTASSVVTAHRWDKIWEVARDGTIWKARYGEFFPCGS